MVKGHHFYHMVHKHVKQYVILHIHNSTGNCLMVMDIDDKNNQHHQIIELNKSGVNVTKQKCDEYQSGP